MFPVRATRRKDETKQIKVIKMYNKEQLTIPMSDFYVKNLLIIYLLVVYGNTEFSLRFFVESVIF